MVRIQRKYFYTQYEVKVQVFNDMCDHMVCSGPTSLPVTIYSAEDLPQVAPTQVGARPFNSTGKSFKVQVFKVYIFWESHKILRNLHQLFSPIYYIKFVYSERFTKFEKLCHNFIWNYLVMSKYIGIFFSFVTFSTV